MIIVIARPGRWIITFTVQLLRRLREELNKFGSDFTTFIFEGNLSRYPNPHFFTYPKVSPHKFSDYPIPHFFTSPYKTIEKIFFLQTAYSADTLVNDGLLTSSSPSNIDLSSYDPDVPPGTTKASLTDSITYSILESANSDKFLVRSYVDHTRIEQCHQSFMTMSSTYDIGQ